MNNETQQSAAARAQAAAAYIAKAPTPYEQLRDMLHAVAEQFAYYARNHREKARQYPPSVHREEAEKKAETNERWVERIKAVLGDAPKANPNDPTTQELWITIGTLAHRLAAAEASEADKKQAIEGHARHITELQGELDRQRSTITAMHAKIHRATDALS